MKQIYSCGLSNIICGIFLIFGICGLLKCGAPSLLRNLDYTPDENYKVFETSAYKLESFSRFCIGVTTDLYAPTWKSYDLPHLQHYALGPNSCFHFTAPALHFSFIRSNVEWTVCDKEFLVQIRAASCPPNLFSFCMFSNEEWRSFTLNYLLSWSDYF